MMMETGGEKERKNIVFLSCSRFFCSVCLCVSCGFAAVVARWKRQTNTAFANPFFWPTKPSMAWAFFSFLFFLSPLKATHTWNWAFFRRKRGFFSPDLFLNLCWCSRMFLLISFLLIFASFSSLFGQPMEEEKKCGEIKDSLHFIFAFFFCCPFSWRKNETTQEWDESR